MSGHDAFERILASLYDAMLDDVHWPATTALIDAACGSTSNVLLVGEGPPDDIRVLTAGLYSRGQRHEDLEREYLEVYHPIDEGVPRLRQLPDSRLVHVTDLYTAEELKTSATYNEILPRARYQNGLNVRLDGPDRSHMTWALGDPVASDGWGSSEIAMIRKLLPHIRQFIRVRQALVRAEARAAEARAEAAAAVEDFRADYPTRLHFVYTLSDRAQDPPFNVEAMWHDGQFTYLRSHAQESPALYEAVDGDPSLVAYDLTEDGLYIVRRRLDSGWLQIGERRAIWRYEPER